MKLSRQVKSAKTDTQFTNKEDKMNYRVAVVSNLGNIFSLSSGDKGEIDNFLLDIGEKEGLKYYRIINADTKETLETQDGVRN